MPGQVVRCRGGERGANVGVTDARERALHFLREGRGGRAFSHVDARSGQTLRLDDRADTEAHRRHLDPEIGETGAERPLEEGELLCPRAGGDLDEEHATLELHRAGAGGDLDADRASPRDLVDLAFAPRRLPDHARDDLAEEHGRARFSHAENVAMVRVRPREIDLMADTARRTHPRSAPPRRPGARRRRPSSRAARTAARHPPTPAGPRSGAPGRGA